MTPPYAAALYAGLNALILIWLIVLVVRRRGAAKVALGDGGDAELIRLIRGHANAAETMPMGLILLALAELLGAPGLAAHLLGLVFTGGRLLHALHFAGIGPLLFRAAGMMATLGATLVLALGLVAHAALRIAS